MFGVRSKPTARAIEASSGSGTGVSTFALYSIPRSVEAMNGSRALEPLPDPRAFSEPVPASSTKSTTSLLSGPKNPGAACCSPMNSSRKAANSVAPMMYRSIRAWRRDLEMWDLELRDLERPELECPEVECPELECPEEEY